MSKPWEQDWSAESADTGAKPWEQDFETEGGAQKPAKKQSFIDGIAEFGLDMGKRAAGAVVSGVASIPLGIEKGVKSLVRSSVEASGDSMVPAGIYNPGIDTDETIHGPETQRDKDARFLAAERAASGIPNLPGARSLAKAGQDGREAIHATTSEATRQAVADSQITGNIFKGEIDFGKDPSVRGFVMQASDVFGSMLPVVVGSLLTKSPNVGGAIGGSMAAGEGAESASRFIAGKTDDELMQQSPFFARLVNGGASYEEARRLTLDKASESAALLQGTVASVGDRFTGKLVTGKLDPLLTRAAGKSIAGKTAAGAVLSGAEEGVQEVGEGVASDIGVTSVVPTKEIGEDSAANLVLGAMGGAPAGAGRGAYSGIRDRFSGDQGVTNQAQGSDGAVINEGAIPEAGQDQAATPARIDGTAAPVVSDTGRPASTVQAAGVATSSTDEAERALREPVNLTALDRADQLGAELQRLEKRMAELSPENGYGPAFDTERNDLAQQAQQIQAERDSIARTWPTAIKGAPTSFSTEAGVKLDGEYALVDADDLVTSHDENLRQNPLFPPELQPRDRSRQASELQVSSIVQRLDPARLGVSADAATGAPIVGADGLVESGNARTIALKRVYQAQGQKAEDYKAWLRQSAAQFGITPEAVDGMRKPVLVRVRATPVNRAEFARQANQSTIQRMSPSEQASADARRLTSLEGLQPDDNGDFSTSYDFIRQFMATLPITEQSDMIESDGRLSTTGYRRMQNAILAKAYGDSPTLRRMTESLDNNLVNVSKALVRAAPSIAAARDRVQAGSLYDADIAPDLVQAVEGLSSIKDKGWTVAQELGQTDLTGPKYSAEAADLLQFLADNIRSPRRIAEFLQRYYEALEAAGDPNQGSLLGDTEAPTRADLLKTAKGTNEQEQSTDRPAGQDRQQPEDAQGRGQGPGGNEGASQNAQSGQQGAADGQAEWVMFPEDSGTLGIPRALMPQVKVTERPALIAFLKSRGIEHERAAVPASDLKPTQAEFSPKKVRGWMESDTKGDRSVLVSSDGYVLDGHHQWMGSVAANDQAQVIRFNAPIKELLAVVRSFPGVKQSDGANDLTLKRAEAVQDFKDALADLAAIASKHTRAAMVPEDTPGLMPTLVKLFDSAIRIAGTDMKATTKWVKDQLKQDPRFKTFWNKIAPATYNKAALQAMETRPKAAEQGSLFDDLDAATDAVQGDLFDLANMLAETPPKVATINGREYNPARDNFKPPATDTFIAADVLEKARAQIRDLSKAAAPIPISEADRARAEVMIKPLIRRAEDTKAEYDQKVIDIAKKTGALGQMLTTVKSLDSATRKLVNEAMFDANKMYDMLRSTIVVSSYADAQVVLDAIREQFDVLPGRVKNMTDAEIDGKRGSFVPSGYGQVLVNVKLPNGVIAEIQINVPEMLAVKLAEGHALYEIERAEKEGSKARADAVDSQREIYPLAAAAAAARNEASSDRLLPGDMGKSLAGVKASSPVSSSSRNTRPSGNLTNSVASPLVPNSQPGGNLSGTLIGTPLDSNVPQLAVNGYNEPDLFGGDDATAQPGQGNAQGQGARPVQGNGQQGDVGGVRARRSRGDQQQRGDDDAAAARGAKVGQPGADGERQANPRRRSGAPGNGDGAVGGVPAGRDIAPKSGLNYRFGNDDLTYTGSWFSKAEANIAAIEVLKRLQKDGRQATADEQKTMAKFIGWGSSELANNLFGDKLNKAASIKESAEKALAAMDKAGKDSLKPGGYDTVGYRRQYVSGDPEFMDAFKALQAVDPQITWYTHKEITRDMIKKVMPDKQTLRWIEMRDRLKALLTPEEFADASRSTQYAHYTSKAVVSSMWRAAQRMGFAGGTILEPGSGIGIFPGLMPEGIAASSSYTGIEFEPMTGGILKQLFPDERILVESFVDTKLPKNFFDVAIGNPPFSGTKILGDPEYAKRALSLHDYFFAKTIDRVKPGGLVMFVTSRYTMDKLDDKARKYLAERADLVGAIRLPQTAFKANAGTEVVTDVLFLRKKVPGETFTYAQPWLGVAEAKTADGKTLMVSGNKEGDADRPAMINEYFAAHPEMVLGQHSAEGSMRRAREYTVTPLAGDIEEQFAKAVETLPADIYKAERGSAAEAAKVREIDFNPKAQKEGNYYVTDAGVLMIREEGVGQRVQLKSAKDVELIKDFVPLRDALKQAHYDQLTDGDWQPSLAALQKEYERFTKKHGQVNQFTTKVVKTKAIDEDTGQEYTDEATVRVFPLLQKLRDDPDYSLVAALETINDDTGEIKPSAFLTQRVLGKPEEPAINSPVDALLTVLNDVGRVDVELIAQRVGMSEQDTIEALGSTVYQDPEAGWQTADEYLSGNVRKKLEAARAAAQADRRFERNVTALEAAQPAPKVPSQISPGLGENWIPGSDYAQFLYELAGVRAEVEFNDATKQWIVKEISGGKTTRATADHGTDQRNATDLLEHALTGRPVRITKTEGTGKDRKAVFDAAGTEAANQKLDAMREAFQSWVWNDSERTDRLVKIYNDRFNTTVSRKFDGSHLTLPGTSKAFQVFDHVKRGAWRIIQQGNTYLAHAVGSGKTFQMVIAAMEQKRLGLIKKPMVVVPNHMLKQFAHEWQLLYPAARLMVADENNFHTDNRRRFVSRVALSDLDGVIITHSAFKLLDLDGDFKRKMIEEQLEFMQAALSEAQQDDKSEGGGRKSPRVKQIEKQIENMEQKLEAAMSSEGKDKNVRFDELGVDFLMVDEAHEYRKLDFATTRQVKGISPQGSAKAFDLYMKSRYLEEKQPGRSLVMASGTVITNTLAELYTVQKFMDRQALIDRNIDDFDSWAAMFGRERTTLEPDAAGRYTPVTRFTKFVKVPALTQMFREFADVLTSDHLAALLGDKRPKVEGGSRSITVTPKTPAYAEYQKELERRVEESRAWKPSKDQPNNPDPMIRIIGDGRLAAIDMRFINPSLPSDPDSKLNRMIDDVIAKFKETADLEYRDKAGNVEPNKGASMMVFSDLGFGEGVAESRGFNARAWFEKRIRDAGVPMNQVAFMSDYKKSADKLKLFKDVNAGRVRVLVGSSKNMGTGVNAQQRLKTLFHLDSPWYPADLEQREGRIVRQGNKNPLVQIYAYAAKGTYDENMWKMLASKQYFIDQAMSGDESLTEIEDLDSQSQFDLAAAMVAEDPRVLQLAGARAEIEKLQRLYQAHEDQRQRFRSQFEAASVTVEFNEKRLPEAEKAAALAKDLSGDKFTAKVGSKVFTERAKWAEALVAEFDKLTAAQETKPRTVAEISGFPVVFGGETVAGQYVTRLVLGTPEPKFLHESYDIKPNLSGLAMRAQNAVADVARQPAKMRERITEARAQMDALRERLSAPFPMSAMLADKIKEAQAIEDAIKSDSTDKTYRVERKADGLGFDVKAVNESAAIMKAIETNGGAPEEWVAKLQVEETQAEADSPRLSLRARDGNTDKLDFDRLQALAKRVKAGMPNMPRVHVLSDPSKAPRALREYIIRQDAWYDVEGAMHDGELYLFASGLADEARAEHVLVEHEAAHYGLRAILGTSLKSAMRLIHAQNASVRKAATELQKRGKLSDEVATEEVIVDIPTAQLAQLRGWRKLVLNVRDWLDGRGYTALAQKLTDWLDGTLTQQQRADLFVAELVGAARDYVAGKRPGRAGAIFGTRLSGTLAEDIAKQEAWLQAEARARGFKDIEDLLERDYPTFEKLAELWRKKNPAEALLSRSAPPGGAGKTVADRAEAIIQKKAGGSAPLDAIARAATKVTGVERLTGAIYDRAGALLDRMVPEKVKAGIVSDYGVPEAVIDQRIMLQGRQRVQLRKAGTLIEKLATLTREESRVAYEWMNMDGSDPKAYLSMMQGLPEESVQVLQEVQKLIDDLSQEAVRLGQLDKEAFERNRFAYLRRSYAKHILAQTAGEKAKRSRVISILGDQYKGRGLVQAEPMSKMQAASPDWWGRKLKDGKADTALKGQKFIRLEKRPQPGAGTRALPGMDPAAPGRTSKVVYVPAGQAIPQQFSDWIQADTWEVRDVKGGNVVLWRDFTKDERQQMGEVDEARFAIAKTMHAMIHDVEVGRYLEWLARNYSKAEGQTIPGVVVDASERYRDTFAPNEWVKVPDTKIPGTSVLKYGALAGHYLPGPIWNDLRQVVGGQFRPFGDAYAKILSMWKTSKTALSPAVHMNNVMSNFVMADWQDVRAVHVAKSLRIILAASGKKGGIADSAAALEVLNRYKDSGGDIGSWVTQEIAKEQLDPILSELEVELAATADQAMDAQAGIYAALQHALGARFPAAWEALASGKTGKAVGNAAGALIDLYQAEDDVFRLAAWLKAKEDGADDLAAGKKARRSFLDYNINAPWVQAMRSTAWPFISFTYRAVPLLFEIAGKKPHKLMKLMMLAGGLNALGVLLGGGGDDDERKMLPEEKAGRIWGMVPKLIRMPWNDEHGSPVYLDIRRWVPVGDVFDVGAGNAAVPMFPGLMPGGPLVIAGEIVLNKSAFTGKPLTLETDTGAEKAAKVGDYLYKAFAPNIVGLPNTYATEGVVGSMTGRTDAFGRELSTPQAMASAFGVKLGSYPADVLRRNLGAKAMAEASEIDKNIGQLKRQLATGRIDRQEFDEQAAVQIEKKRKLMQEVREKLN